MAHSHAACAHTRPTSAAHVVRPNYASAAHDGDTHVRQSFCENALGLPDNSASTKCTIPSVCDYAKWPLQQPVFTSRRSLTWLRTSARRPVAPIAPAGHLGPSPPYLRSRYVPRHERKTLGDENASQDAAVKSDQGGGAPFAKL